MPRRAGCGLCQLHGDGLWHGRGRHHQSIPALPCPAPETRKVTSVHWPLVSRVPRGTSRADSAAGMPCDLCLLRTSPGMRAPGQDQCIACEAELGWGWGIWRADVEVELILTLGQQLPSRLQELAEAGGGARMTRRGPEARRPCGPGLPPRAWARGRSGNEQMGVPGRLLRCVGRRGRLGAHVHLATVGLCGLGQVACPLWANISITNASPAVTATWTPF